MFKVAKFKPTGMCPAFGCRKPVGKKKKYCPRHHHAYQKHTNLVGYTYSLLKGNAHKRGKAFDLTLDEFKNFCERTGYLINKGKSAGSASIDRIDPSKGYSIGNIQVISLADNSAKMHRDKQDSEEDIF
jgi:hypothetical protein